MLTAVQLVKKMKPYCLTLFLGLWSSSSQDQFHNMSIILSIINLIFEIFMFAKTSSDFLNYFGSKSESSSM